MSMKTITPADNPSAPERVNAESTEVATEALSFDAEASPEQATPPPLSVGEQLQAAREALGLSRQEVAQALRLSLMQIDAIDANEWSKLSCNTTVRGFVRNYAKYVKLDPEVLLPQLDSILGPRTLQLPVLPPGSGQALHDDDNKSSQRWNFLLIAAGVAITAVALLSFFFFPEAPESGKPQRSSATAANAASVAVDSTATAPVVAPVTATPAALPDKAEPVKQDLATRPVATASTTTATKPPAPPATAPAAKAAGLLRFSFQADSWVEVRDSTGRNRLYQRNAPGSSISVDGTPPFEVVVGNAPEVQLDYAGKAFDMTNYINSNAVARFTLP